MSFVAQVIRLKLFCRKEKISEYHLKKRTHYVKKDLEVAIKWLLSCGIDIDEF